MKFFSLKILPTLLLLSIFAPAKVNSSMKDAYNKNNANKSSCNKQTAQFAKKFPSGSDRKLIETAPNSWNWRDIKYAAYNKYFCLLDNGAIMTFSDRELEVKEYGNIKKTEYSKPYWDAAWEMMTDGTRTEYSVENNSLYRYRCDGYYECLSEPTRTLVAAKYVPITTRSAANYDYYSEYLKDGLKNYKEKNYGLASKLFGMAINQKPDSIDAYQGRGSSRYLQKKYDLAIEDFNKVISLNPNLEGAYLYKGLSQILSDKANEDNNLVINGCKNIIQAQKLGSKAAINFMSKKNLCQKYL